MFKRLAVVAVALLVTASSSFASWDYFPPKEAGKGEVELGFMYLIPGEKISATALGIGARYSIIESLEAAVVLPLPMSYSYDGESAEKFFGLSLPEIGVRYWLPMNLGFFLDFVLPIDTRDEELYGKPSMSIGLGVQYSANFTEQLSLGSQLGLIIPFENSDTKYTEGMDLGIGVELDYSVGMATPYVGLDLAFGVTKPKFDGETIDGMDAAKMGIDLAIGSTFDFNESFGADVFLGFGFGERNIPTDDDKMPIEIGVSVSYNF